MNLFTRVGEGQGLIASLERVWTLKGIIRATDHDSVHHVSIFSKRKLNNYEKRDKNEKFMVHDFPFEIV
jgi:hypothetical protein